MAINPLSGAGSAISGAGTPKPSEGFSKAMKGQMGAAPKPENQSQTLKNPTEAKGTNQAVSQGCEVKASGSAQNAQASQKVTKSAEATAAKVLDRVGKAQGRMEEILKLAESGKSFSPAELLSLQAHIYKASQELDMAGKVVEKATGGLKQVLSTQV
jgi:flagellar hook-basal body complex protein FliE